MIQKIAGKRQVWSRNGKVRRGADRTRPRGTPPLFRGNPLKVTNQMVGDQRAGQYPEEHPSPQLGDLPITAQVGGLINTQSLKFFQWYLTFVANSKLVRSNLVWSSFVTHKLFMSIHFFKFSVSKVLYIELIMSIETCIFENFQKIHAKLRMGSCR